MNCDYCLYPGQCIYGETGGIDEDEYANYGAHLGNGIAIGFVITLGVGVLSNVREEHRERIAHPEACTGILAYVCRENQLIS